MSVIPFASSGKRDTEYSNVPPDARFRQSSFPHPPDPLCQPQGEELNANSTSRLLRAWRCERSKFSKTTVRSLRSNKWFARRPGTLFRALLLSEFAAGPVQDTFFQAHQLKGIRVADPFMGGGTPLLEANRAGCDVLGYDINPMAYWIVKQEIERLDLPAYQKAASEVSARLEEQVGPWYRTTCLSCRQPDAQVKYFVWVKTQQCSGCGKNFDLFPGLSARTKPTPPEECAGLLCLWRTQRSRR